MKRITIMLAIMLPLISVGQNEKGSVRIGAGYMHDFPGMNGFGSFAEYARPLAEKWEVAIGGKWSNMHGYPRTKDVMEYTRAFGFEFNIYFLPLTSETQQLRIGAGYAFSFYKIRRTYPLITNEGGTTITNWPVQDNDGRVGGANLVAEYEFFIPNSMLSLGARASCFKAYDGVVFAGVFVGIRF